MKTSRTILLILLTFAATFGATAKGKKKGTIGIYHGECISLSNSHEYRAMKVAELPKFNADDGTQRVVQAMDICNGVAFIGFDGGYCRTIMLKDMSVLGEFELGSHIPSNHCGNLDFGIEYPEGSHYPALYVSGDLTTFSCYVESISEHSSKLIQTIRFDLPYGYNGSQVIIDHERECIWYMQRKGQKINIAENQIVLFRFRLPRLAEGDVTFTADDILECKELPIWLRLYQGAEIIGGRLFEVNGICRKENPSAQMTVFDLYSGKVPTKLDLSFIDREPQGVSSYEGALYINFQDSIWKFEF